MPLRCCRFRYAAADAAISLIDDMPCHVVAASTLPLFATLLLINGALMLRY